MTRAAVRPGVDVDLDELIGLRLRAPRLSLRAARRREAGASPGVSRFRGRGMEYAESRIYLPGDDIRYMDWKVTARSGDPHVKLFQEERERPVFLLVDYSPSMFFGTRVCFKSVLAARAAALLAWSALAAGDRVGALIAAHAEHLELRPAAGKRGVLRVLQGLARAGRYPGPQEDDASDLGAALDRARRVVRPGSLVVVLSDGYGLDEAAEHHLQRLRDHNDLLLCAVADDLELAPPGPGRYPIARGGDTVMLDAAHDDVRAAWRDYHQRRRERAALLCRRLAAPLLDLVTSRDPALSLQARLQPAARAA